MTATDQSAASGQWEHGYRCHGYWIANVRWGLVGIWPRNYWTKADGYGWSFHPYGIVPSRGEIRGTEPTLKKAKARVEEAYRSWLKRQC